MRPRSVISSIARPKEQGPYHIRIGAQVSSAGGLALAVERAVAMGASALQLFVDQNRRFPRNPLSAEQLDRLRVALAEHDLPAFVHVPYLSNVATFDETLRERSIDMIARALEASARSGLRGVVAHPGSHLGHGFEAVRARVREGLREAFARARAEVPLLIENTAGGGGQIGSTPAELRALLDDLDADGLPAAICLDTQHAHAAGHDVSSDRGVAALVETLRGAGLLERIALLHANDSGSMAGSRRDFHANPGEGTIGPAGFRALARVAEFSRVPWILEVPGLERSGPRREEIERLRAILRASAVGSTRRAGGGTRRRAPAAGSAR